MKEKEKRILSVIKASGKWMSVKAIHRAMVPQLDYRYLEKDIEELVKQKKLKRIETTSGRMYYLNSG